METEYDEGKEKQERMKIRQASFDYQFEGRSWDTSSG
jgi:hypothetical protein